MLDLHAVVRDLCPPAALAAARRWRPAKPPALFDGDGALFRRLAAEASVYGEYGCGQSTLWVYGNTDARIVAVDSARAWARSVKSAAPEDDRLDIAWVNLGPVAEWGRPLSYDRRALFPDYVDSIWRRGVAPDLVLIDGRFRVACFLQSLLAAAPGTRLLFDDYFGRPHYRLVEEFTPVAESCGRQACFVTPVRFDRAKAEALKQQFMMVMD